MRAKFKVHNLRCESLENDPAAKVGGSKVKVRESGPRRRRFGFHAFFHSACTWDPVSSVIKPPLCFVAQNGVPPDPATQALQRYPPLGAKEATPFENNREAWEAHQLHPMGHPWRGGGVRTRTTELRCCSPLPPCLPRHYAGQTSYGQVPA